MKVIVEVLGADGSVQGWVVDHLAGTVTRDRSAATEFDDIERAERQRDGATTCPTRIVPA